jgi:hypothetical protein
VPAASVITFCSRCSLRQSDAPHEISEARI